MATSIATRFSCRKNGLRGHYRGDRGITRGRCPMLHRIAVAAVLLALTPPARAGLEIWDTGKASAEALAPAAIEAKAGWTKMADPGAVKGDAVLMNGRLTAVIRRSGATELYGTGAARAKS